MKRKSSETYYELDQKHTDPKRVRNEREKSRKLKKSQWWLTLLNQGTCHYCKKKFSKVELTMDHIVPIARGGSSTKSNVAPACKTCNQGKKLDTPVDIILKKL